MESQLPAFDVEWLTKEVKQWISIFMEQSSISLHPETKKSILDSWLMVTGALLCFHTTEDDLSKQLEPAILDESTRNIFVHDLLSEIKSHATGRLIKEQKELERLKKLNTELKKRFPFGELRDTFSKILKQHGFELKQILLDSSRYAVVSVTKGEMEYSMKMYRDQCAGEAFLEQRFLAILCGQNHTIQLLQTQLLNQGFDCGLIFPAFEGYLFPGIIEEEPSDIVKQLLEAVQYCHSHNILHRDICLENIGYKEGKEGNMQIVLTNFDKAITYDKKKAVCGRVGSLHSTAPEIVKGGAYEFSADIWSIGIVYAELHAEHRLFSASDDTEYQRQFKRVMQKIDDVDGTGLLIKLLASKPNKRISIAQALKLVDQIK